MRKILIMILAICLLLSLAGCTTPANKTQGSTSSSTSAEPTAEDTTVASDADASVEQMPMVSVAVPVITQTEEAHDGTVIFNYTFQNISLIVPDPEVADKVIVDFLNRIDQTSSNAEAIRSAAQNNYTTGASWNPYLCQITYDPMRVDYGVLSMFGSYASYSGTPHPETSYVSANYDLVTGELLSLDDILTEDASADTLYQSVVDALTLLKEENYLYEGFEETVNDRFSKGLAHDDAWYFSQDGLCFYFSPYEIAPYSSGVIIAEVPYDQLTGILNDAYFPAERETAAGSVDVEIFDENDLEKFTQFAEIVLAEGSDKILLHTDKSVYDIRIETGSWSSDGSTFTPEHTVFAAYSLTPGDAIMVESQFKDTLPTLRLCYTTNGKTVWCYISLSDDGTVALTTD